MIYNPDQHTKSEYGSVEVGKYERTRMEGWEQGRMEVKNTNDVLPCIITLPRFRSHIERGKEK
jgi:hypothetical protein